jgi:hypothetical protein
VRWLWVIPVVIGVAEMLVLVSSDRGPSGGQTMMHGAAELVFLTVAAPVAGVLNGVVSALAWFAMEGAYDRDQRRVGKPYLGLLRVGGRAVACGFVAAACTIGLGIALLARPH